MIFRNELKELMNALHLTKALEDELNKNEIKGTSLSDKIKSFETKTKEDFEDEYDEDNEAGYQYRKYKRELLGGNYNNLRWVAHERNQLMHQSGYFVHDFKKFKRTLRNSIIYFKNNQTNSFDLRNFLITFGSSIVFLIPLGWLAFAFKDKLLDPEAYSLLSIVFILFGMGIAFQLGEALSDIFKSLFELVGNIINGLGVIQITLTKNRKTLFLALLIIFLWNKNFDDIIILFEHLEGL